MDWKTFFEQRPLKGERILVIREWLDYDFELHQPKRCWSIYECNYNGIIKKNINYAKSTTVDLVNLKMVTGEKLNLVGRGSHFTARALHWARLD